MKKTKTSILSIALIGVAFSFSEEMTNTTTECKSRLEYVVSQTSDPGIIHKTYNDITSWSTSGRQILLNGKPFFAKGMCYQPVPAGEDPSAYPNGDYYLAAYKSTYQADIDKMKNMGVNAIKIYSWYPDKDHTDFLNYCYNNGIYIIVGYYMPAADVVNNFTNVLQSYKTLAQNTYTHPGIMGYLDGNETNSADNINNQTYWTNLNAIAAALKGIAPNKLITTAMVDDGMVSVQKGNNSMTSLDVWGIDVYRGKSLGTLYDDYETASKKPMMLLEAGFPNSIRNGDQGAGMPDNGQATADYINDMMTEINDNSSDDEPGDAVGGVFYFEFCDEWWKQNCPACLGQPCACSKNTHDFRDNVKTDAFPGRYWDEEWFGAFTVDKQPRAVVSTLKSLWTK